MLAKYKQLVQPLAKRGAVVGVLCAVVCMLLNHTAAVQRLENAALDACFQLRGERASQSNIVLVTIDDATLSQLNKPLVLISPELAEVVEYITQQGARAVGVDLLIPESAEALQELRQGGLGDADRMGRAVGETGAVVLCESITGDKAQGPLYQWLPFNPAYHDVGFANLTVDGDMTLRRQQLRAAVDDAPHPSLAMALYAKADDRSSDWFAAPELEIGGDPVPLQDDRLLVNYVGSAGAFPRISFADLLNAARSNGAAGEARPNAQLRDAIVIIGGEFEIQADAHATPFSTYSNIVTFMPAAWLGYSPELMSGVEVQANVLATLADEAFIVTPWLLQTPLLLLLVGGLLGSALHRLNLETGLVLTIAHHVVWKTVCVAAFGLLSWRIELTAMLLLGPIIYATIFARRWRVLRRMLGLFKSEAVARSLEASPEQMGQQGQAREVSILFTDIRGFTSFSESNDPKRVVRLLNAFFTAVVPEIEKRGGVVNQYLGDGMMVMFGAPDDQPEHAQQAVATGLALLEKVEALHEQWKQLGADTLRIGVGIHTGIAITGIIGSPNRLDYTAIGDTVNTASRIESATKEEGARLLLSQQTLDAMPAGQFAEWRLTPVQHAIQVKGKHDELTVYSLDVAPSS